MQKGVFFEIFSAYVCTPVYGSKVNLFQLNKERFCKTLKHWELFKISYFILKAFTPFFIYVDGLTKKVSKINFLMEV